MSSWQASRALLLALAVSIAWAGCGSSSGSSRGTSTGPGGGFIAQLGSACRADSAAIAATKKTVATESPIQRRFIQTLHKLTPPPALKSVFRKYVSLLERDLAAFEHHDLATGRRLRPQIVAVAAKLQKAGVTGC